MERIKPEELPDVLTEDIIDVLARMADEIPQSREWHAIFDILDPIDFNRVMDRMVEFQRLKEEERLQSLTQEERKAEEEIKRKFYENLDPNGFYGNMGEPATLGEFKSRYGVYPPGYDKDGNKIEV